GPAGVCRVLRPGLKKRGYRVRRRACQFFRCNPKGFSEIFAAPAFGVFVGILPVTATSEANFYLPNLPMAEMTHLEAADALFDRDDVEYPNVFMNFLNEALSALTVAGRNLRR